MKRSFDAGFINAVITHESVVRGAECGLGSDLTPIVQDYNNHLLVNEHGGFIIVKKLPGVYEYHTQFLPEGRGTVAIEAAEESLLYMFTKTDCERVITKVHSRNKSAQRFASLFMDRKGMTGDYHYYCLTIDEWIEISSKCAERGAEFHGEVDTNHDDDEIHNNYAGAACLMAEAGNIRKAAFYYNRWAVMSGYEPAVIVSEHPPVVLLGDMVMTMDGGKLCQ